MNKGAVVAGLEFLHYMGILFCGFIIFCIFAMIIRFIFDYIIEKRSIIINDLRCKLSRLEYEERFRGGSSNNKENKRST